MDELSCNSDCGPLSATFILTRCEDQLPSRAYPSHGTAHLLNKVHCNDSRDELLSCHFISVEDGGESDAK